jgi:dCTP deaminase
MSVLADWQIEAECGRYPLVDPYRPKRLQPASIDLLLADEFRIFEHGKVRYVDLTDPKTYAKLTKSIVADTFVLHPGEFILASTQEHVTLPPNLMARVEGKSSLGRLGLIIHATAGFIDPGFQGDITLEMTNLLRVPIVLHAGQPICQVSFSWMSAVPRKTYDGHYQGQRGVTASRWEP